MNATNFVQLYIFIIITVIGAVIKYKTRQKVKNLEGFGTICSGSNLEKCDVVVIETSEEK